eukprot:UC1_evm1s1022
MKQGERERREGGGNEEERTLLVLGSKRGGKTSLILRFLDRGRDVPKPTTALEYTYGRKSRSVVGAAGVGKKDVAHIWELGGGTQLSRLVETPITAQGLRTLAVVLCVDLSAPEQLWRTVVPLLSAVRKRIDKLLSDLDARKSRLPAHLRARAWKKFGDSHPDKAFLRPLPVPLLIVGTKYDLFRNARGPQERKMI